MASRMLSRSVLDVSAHLKVEEDVENAKSLGKDWNLLGLEVLSLK